MIAAVDLSGGIVLYSGMNLVGKVYVAGIPSALTTSSYLSLNLGSQFASPFPRYVSFLKCICVGPYSVSKAAFPNAKSADHLASAYFFYLTCGGFVECIFLWTVSHVLNERHFLNGKD